MIGRRWHRWWWSLGICGTLLALAALARFPWKEMIAALAGANAWLLLFAALVNLLSPFFKGCGWYVLLRRIAPCRWRIAQEANLIGSAVTSLSVGVTGEAARIGLVIERDGVPASAAILSVAVTRLSEGLALACFVMLAPLRLEIPPQLRAIQLGGAIAIAALAVVLMSGNSRTWKGMAERSPVAIHRILQQLAIIGGGRRLLAPIAFGFGSWMVEWFVYRAVLVATLGQASYSAAFTALIATNLSGLLRLTPANVGVFQATMVAALLPFGVPVERAVAAGLALQAVHVLPVLALTGVVVQRARLGWAFKWRPVTTP
jgi:phosphatidylinositol alpha-mannosyltransferase